MKQGLSKESIYCHTNCAWFIKEIDEDGDFQGCSVLHLALNIKELRYETHNILEDCAEDISKMEISIGLLAESLNAPIAIRKVKPYEDN
jgi:hypothetical protein